jgi:GTP 3',8-cyclase
MSAKFVPRTWTLIDQREISAHLASSHTGATTAHVPPKDQFDRPLRDLRISVTDRCNFRCSYCMPKAVFDSNYPYLPHHDLLTFEEITRLAQVFVALGVEKIRLTGGEPLLRKNIDHLIDNLASLRTPNNSALDLTLTTNGALLRQKAATLKAAGLQRITVSLDALNDAVFRRMNDVDFGVAEVLAGIEKAHAVGLGPIKVNMVVQRGVNEDEIVPMAQHFRGTGITLRFIEFMDVGSTNGWRMDDVVPAQDIIARIQQHMPLMALPAQHMGETAQRWGYQRADGSHDSQAGEIGVIGSVSQAFCGQCTRARLSTEGKLYLCLFAHQGYDLRSILRNGADDAQLRNIVANLWSQRSDRYSQLRSSLPTALSHPKVEMSYIGG